MKRSIQNITIYTTSDFPYGGAAENFLRQIALGLNECGAKIRIVRLRGRRFGGENNTCIPCSNLLLKNNPKNDVLKILKLIALILLIPFSVISSKLFHKSSAILLYGIDYSYDCIPFIFTAKLLNLKSFRINADYCDIEHIWWKRVKFFFYERQFKQIDKLFTGIIVLSTYLKDLAIKNGVQNSNILLIPHFIDILSFTTDSIMAEQETPKTTIGFCGTPTISNGILDLLEAYKIVKKKLKNVELLIIGNPSENIKRIIDEQTMISKYKNITYTGFLQKEEVRLNLNRCTILVNPRKSGRLADAGFPTKLGEYFACKKPVVTTNVGDISKYFTTHIELMIAEPGNPEDLAKNIIWLIQHPNEKAIIAENGYNWATNNLNYINNAQKLYNFINEA